MKRLFAVDTMAVLYRAYFAMIRNPLINSKGINVSGLHGLTYALVGILEREQPDYLAVVSDTPHPTFRHKLFPEYKATREKMPEELVAQLPYIPRLVKALHLPYLLLEGYEADDIIGTLAAQAEARSLDSYMVTGDKDYMQLINEHTCMYAARGEQVTLTRAPEVWEKFGCRPDQVIDVLALMGDASDNVPGVRGVGAKTATKLIQQYDTLDAIYAHIPEIKGNKLKENLLEFRDNAFLSRELVTIDRQVPLPVDFEALALRPAPLVGNSALLELLTELELQSLRDRLMQQSGGPAAPTAKGTPRAVTYELLCDMAAVDALIGRLEAAEMVVFDTETTGLDYFQDEIIGLSFAVNTNEAFYIPLNHPALAPRRTEVLQKLKPLLECPHLPKGGHNMKYDIHMLRREGITVQGATFDTMIASHLAEPAERRHDLDSVSLRTLGITKIPTSELIGKGKDQITMADVPIDKVGYYACEDADATFQLHQTFAPRLKETGQQPIFDSLEMPLVNVLVNMEQVGIRFNREGALALSVEMEGRLAEARHDIYEIAGEKDFNINSIVDLQRVMYEKLKVHELTGVRPKKIKTGMGLSTDEETLAKMDSHPFPQSLLAYRELAKLKSTYLDNLPNFINPATGRIHSSFRQHVAATGRLASDNPNLQNIPVRSEEGRRVRALFVASDADHVLLSADYSQIELRVVADYSGDPTFLEAFRTGEDIHALTAMAIFGVAPEAVDREMRSVAKEVNFGLIYRMGAERLAQVTKRNRQEAQEFIARFFEKFATIRALQDSLLEQARKEGFARTKLGRRRYLPEINGSNGLAVRMAEGAAVNTPIQGSAAEIIKLAMIGIDRRLAAEKWRSRMVLTIHDELLFDAHRDELDPLKALVTEEMEQAMALNVPLTVEMGTGDNWLAAH